MTTNCEVTLGVIPVSQRRFAYYDARSRCHSLVRLRWDGDSSFIPFFARCDWTQASCLALKPLVSPLRYGSQVISIRSPYLCPGNYPFAGYSRQYRYTLYDTDYPPQGYVDLTNSSPLLGTSESFGTYRLTWSPYSVAYDYFPTQNSFQCRRPQGDSSTGCMLYFCTSATIPTNEPLGVRFAQAPRRGPRRAPEGRRRRPNCDMCARIWLENQEHQQSAVNSFPNLEKSFIKTSWGILE